MTPKFQELLPPQWQARLQEERRQALLAAANFAAVCGAGDADAAARGYAPGPAYLRT